MNAARALLYARTLPTLRPVQIVGRLRRVFVRPKPDLAPPPPRRTLGPAAAWRPVRLRPTTLLAPKLVELLGVAGEIDTPAAWNDPARSRLWLYHLHYLDDLHAPGADERRAWQQRLVSRWVAENPPGEGVGWEPYPLSLRIVNWIAAALSGLRMEPGERASLAVQARFLRASLETHLFGNHLLANAKALVFAGAYFEGPEADAWRAEGLALLERELAEQVLPDGGHFERSPMYHAIVLHDLLDLVDLARAYPELDALRAAAEGWGRRVRDMLGWLEALTHDDGGIALFNDAALGVAPTHAELAGYAREVGLEPPQPPPDTARLLRESGYARLRAGDALLLCDVGEVGPRHQPGHAHADTLTFELSLGAQRVVVDTGTSHYALDAERLRQRSTAAHNTLEIDGHDSSEVWDSHRVARRARPLAPTLALHGETAVLSSGHDGYARLPGRPVHHREWRLQPGRLEVRDRVEGRFGEATARVHLHPDVRVEVDSDERGGRLLLPDGRALAWRVDGGPARVAPTTWHPRFHSSEPTSCLGVRLRSGAGRFTLTW